MHSNEAARATNQADTLPPHLAETHRAISRLYSEHRERAARLERDAARLTRFIGRPSFLIGIGLAVLVWVAANGLAALGGWHPIDPPPFGLLQSVASVAALFVTVLILSTQRREDERKRKPIPTFSGFAVGCDSAGSHFEGRCGNGRVLIRGS
jgi:uncharacterized membrane protein